MVNEIVFNMVSFPRHPIELRPFDFFVVDFLYIFSFIIRAL